MNTFRHCFVVTSAIVLLAAMRGHAQQSTAWVPLGLPQLMQYINPVYDFARHPDGTLFATTGIVFRSTDEGLHWDSTKNIGLPRPTTLTASRLAIGPDGHMFVALCDEWGNGGLYVSQDKGDSWTRMVADSLQDSLSDPMSIIANHTGTLMYACGGLSGSFKGMWGLVRSTDQGATWNTVGRNIDDYQPTALACGADSTLYLGTTYGVYRSLDDGRTWGNVLGGKSMQIGARNICADRSGRVYVAARGGLFRSSDRGSNWIGLVAGLNSDSLFIAVSSCGDGMVFAATGSKLYRSTDFGDTWSVNHDGLRGSANPMIHASGASALFNDSCGVTLAACGTNDGVVRQLANEIRWRHTTGFGVLHDAPNISISVSPHGKVLAEDVYGNLYSRDVNLWRNITPDTVSPPFYFSSIVCISDSVYMGVTGQGLNQRFMLSSDEGLHWRYQSESWDDILWGIVNTPDGRIYVVYFHGLVQSNDTGKTWPIIAQYSMDDPLPWKLFVTGSGETTNILLRLNINGALTWSTNQGATWTSPHLGVGATSICLTRGSHLLVAGKDSLNQMHLIRFASPNDSAVSLGYPVAPNRTMELYSDGKSQLLAITQDSTLLRSVDEGESWFGDTMGLTQYDVQNNTITFDFDGRAFLNSATGIFVQEPVTSEVGDGSLSRQGSLPHALSITVTPNPAADHAFLSVDANAQKLDIFDCLGRNVAHVAPSSANGQSTVFQLSTMKLRAGVYVCVATTDFGRIAAPFTVIH